MFARRRSTSSSESIALLACLLCVSAHLIGNVVSMSLDRLGAGRSNGNQIDYSEAMMNSVAPEEVDQSASDSSALNSDTAIDASDDGTISVVPVKEGQSDMYLLVPAAGSPSQQEEDVLQSLGEHELALDASSSEGLADMLMLESEDMPAMQILEVPQDIVETKYEEEMNKRHESENEYESATEKISSEEMANSESESEKISNEEIANSESESEAVKNSMAGLIAEAAQEIEKQLETEILGPEEEEPKSDDNLPESDISTGETPMEHKDTDLDIQPLMMTPEEVQSEPEQEMIGVVMEQESTETPLESLDLKVDSNENVLLEDSEQTLNDSAVEDVEMTTEVGDMPLGVDDGMSQMVSESQSMDLEQSAMDTTKSEKLEVEPEVSSENVKEEQSEQSEDVKQTDDVEEPQIVIQESQEAVENHLQDGEVNQASDENVASAENDSSLETSQQMEKQPSVEASSDTNVSADASIAEESLAAEETQNNDEKVQEPTEAATLSDETSVIEDGLQVPASQETLTVQESLNSDESSTSKIEETSDAAASILAQDASNAEEVSSDEIPSNADQHNEESIAEMIDATDSQSDEAAVNEEMQSEQKIEEDQYAEESQPEQTIGEPQAAAEEIQPATNQQAEEESQIVHQSQISEEPLTSASEISNDSETSTGEDFKPISEDMEITADEQHVEESQPDEIVNQTADDDENTKPAEEIEISQTEEETNPSEEIQTDQTEEESKPSEEIQTIQTEEAVIPSEEIQMVEESHSNEDNQNEAIQENHMIDDIKSTEHENLIEESPSHEETKPSQESEEVMTAEVAHNLEDSQPMEEAQAVEELHTVEEISANESSQTAEEETQPSEEIQTAEVSQTDGESAPMKGSQISDEESAQSLESSQAVEETQYVAETGEVQTLENSQASEETALPSMESQSAEVSSEPMNEVQAVDKTQYDEQAATMEEIDQAPGSSESQLISDEIDVAKGQTSSTAIEDETKKAEDDSQSTPPIDNESMQPIEESQQNATGEQLVDNKDDPILSDDTGADNILVNQEQQESDKPQEPSMLTTILQVAPSMPESEMQQQPTVNPLNVMDSVLNYVNASFMNQQTQSQQDEELGQEAAPFSSKLRRYDGAQVWRIVVQNDRERKLADELQSKYDGQLWKEVKQEVDYLLKPQVLADAERHVRAANLSRIVLIDNLQKVIEVENPPAEEIAQLQNRKGHRLTWQAYHRLEDIHGFFDYLAKTYPDICSVETIGYSIEKRPLKLLKISNGNAKNPGIWIDGGMHAREWIGVAVTTYIANQIVEGWDDLPAHMRNVNWYIHAVANPDGYEYSHTTDRLWRKNMRSHGRACPGVDLNRNFGYKWGGKGTSANPCSQTYRGSKAFSEPETFYISKFISNFPRDTFKGFLSFHSYGQYILYPWGYDYHITKDMADLDLVARQAGTSITRSSGVKYTVGSSAHTLYPAAGGSDDWAKGFADIKYSYTIEMGDTGRYGFVLPASHIEPNGKDGYIFAQTVARAITMGKNGRRRKLVAKTH